MGDAMLTWLTETDDILRRAPWVTRPADTRRAVVRLLAQLVAFGLLYGLAMGSFRALAVRPEWLEQMVYSAVKVPLLLTATFSLSLPSFFVLNSLLGLRRELGQAVRALVAAQAGLAIVLASLAPFTLFWYVSNKGYSEALLFNGAMFAIASFSAQWLVRCYYRPLVAANPKHRYVLWGWLAVYSLVAIQMAWLLRPFIGSPGNPVTFLRPDPWDNAYEYVAQLIWRTLF
jgi:hypothetical protein